MGISPIREYGFKWGNTFQFYLKMLIPSRCASAGRGRIPPYHHDSFSVLNKPYFSWQFGLFSVPVIPYRTSVHSLLRTLNALQSWNSEKAEQRILRPQRGLLEDSLFFLLIQFMCDSLLYGLRGNGSQLERFLWQRSPFKEEWLSGKHQSIVFWRWTVILLCKCASLQRL